jgi:chromosomal replication initiation ATPase DnaA
MNGQPEISATNGRGVHGGTKIARDPDSAHSSDLLIAVAAAFDVAPGDLRRPTRGRQEVARARQVGIYLARTVFGMTLSDAGRLFRRDRTTAAHACRLVEDLRDDPRFDRIVTALEDDVRAASQAAPQ